MSIFFIRSRRKPTVKKKSKHPRGKEHSLRGATLARIADDCEAKVKEIKSEGYEFATERILTLQDLALIFRNAAKRERKLR